MMHTLLHSALLFLLLAVLFSDRQVAGRCSEKGVADTPWAACLVAEKGDVCPYNFKKLEDDFACEPYGSRRPPYKKRVCCLLGPILDLQIKDSPCLAGSPAGDQVEKKDKRLKHH